MTNYRYTLEKYKGLKSRFKCPSCQNNSRTFTRYVDNENGEYINDKVGRCDREDKCGYHLTPKEYFLKNGRGLDNNIGIFGLRSSKSMFKPAIPTYIPKEIYNESILPQRNHFLAYLVKLFGET